MKSLYTNIPNNEDIKAVREAYYNHPTNTVATKAIKTFLSLTQTLNNFVFNSICYLQKMEGAAVTTSALACPNTFKAQFEKQQIYPFIKINQYYTYDISMKHSWYGKELTNNYSHF